MMHAAFAKMQQMIVSADIWPSLCSAFKMKILHNFSCMKITMTMIIMVRTLLAYICYEQIMNNN